MEKKIIYTIFTVLSLFMFPVKLVAEIMNPSVVKALWFLLSYVVTAFIMMVVSSKARLVPKEFHPGKNMILSLISLLSCGGCAWGAFAYFKAVKPKDLKVQYFLLMVFCALSALFFIYVFKAHLSDENPFKGFQLLLFAVPIMYLCSLTTFFSCEINKDMYDFFAKALSLLFFVYYSQNYISFKDISYKRNRMVTFGLPASLVTFGYSLSHMQSFQPHSEMYVSRVMHALISLYIISFLFSGPLKSSNSLKPVQA